MIGKIERKKKKTKLRLCKSLKLPRTMTLVNSHKKNYIPSNMYKKISKKLLSRLVELFTRCKFRSIFYIPVAFLQVMPPYLIESSFINVNELELRVLRLVGKIPGVLCILVLSPLKLGSFTNMHVSDPKDFYWIWFSFLKML